MPRSPKPEAISEEFTGRIVHYPSEGAYRLIKHLTDQTVTMQFGKAIDKSVLERLSGKRVIIMGQLAERSNGGYPSIALIESMRQEPVPQMDPDEKVLLTNDGDSAGSRKIKWDVCENIPKNAVYSGHSWSGAHSFHIPAPK